MKLVCALLAMVAFMALTMFPADSYARELTCKSHGEFKRCPLPEAWRLHVNLHKELSNHKCEKGYTWGADSDGIWVSNKCKGVFYYTGDEGYHNDYQEKYSRSSHRAGRCPSDLGGNECEYYLDGYKMGKEDGQMSMSRAYQRHADYYDTRFEPYFARGYTDGWNDYR